jgi:hypothetical protein
MPTSSAGDFPDFHLVGAGERVSALLCCTLRCHAMRHPAMHRDALLHAISRRLAVSSLDFALFCVTLLCFALPCNTSRCSASLCSTALSCVLLSDNSLDFALFCGALLCLALRRTVLQCRAPRCRSFVRLCSVLPRPALPHTTVTCITLRCDQVSSLDFALRCRAEPWITAHYGVLPCIVLPRTVLLRDAVP